MIEFKKWLENLEFEKEVPPSDLTKHIWVNQPNNQQQIDYWKKNNTKKHFTMPLNKDRFIHFSLNETIKSIVETNRIEYGNGGVFAVSCTYGKWVPIVQFNHIINKNKSKKFLAPMDLKSNKKAQMLISKGYQMPEFSKEISAVIFKTNEMPTSGFVEEVYWNKEISIFDCKEIGTRQAISILKNTSYNISDDDAVTYT